MGDQIIQSNCRLLLTKFAELRNPLFKKQRIYKYWQFFEGIGRMGILEKEFYKLTDGESISRAFRKIQQENPELRATIELQQKSAELSERHRINYGTIQAETINIGDNTITKPKEEIQF